MSILIKGIDMTKERTQVIAITPNGEVWQINPIGKNERLEAQAIQIDRPHGDIKDVSKLRDKFSRTESGYCGGWEFCDKPEDFQFLIDDEPTILEAEGEE